MKTRRSWRAGLVAFAAFAIGSFTLMSAATAAPVPGGTLNPDLVPKYVTPLVIPPVMPASTTSPAPAANYDIAVRQFKQQILPGGIWNTVNGRADTFPATTVWSYGRAQDPLPDSTALGGGAGVAPALNSTFNYPSYTVETTSAVPTTVRWINDLTDPATGNFLPHLFAIDQTVHWANPAATGCVMGTPTNRTDCETMDPTPYTGPVPLVTHVHGAHVAPDSDGYPEAWWLPAANNIPPGYVSRGRTFTQADNTNAVPGSAYYSYANTQPAATLWYHDHALGMTRNNVYAGPAGFWLVRGGVNDLVNELPRPAPGLNPDGTPQDVNGLTAGSVRNQIREIPLAIQDRSFNADGSLFYPDSRTFFDGFTGPFIGDMGGAPSDMPAIWNPEVFFNTMVVNGTTWPKLDVAPERYRLRLLNGCNSRTLNLSMFVVTDPGADLVNGTADDVLGAEVPFYQIGAEQGFLPRVVLIRKGFATPLPGNGTIPTEKALPDPSQALLMGLAERADVIVDFSTLANGTRVRMINTAPDAPFGGFPDVPADVGTTGQVMEFVVDNTIPAGAVSTPPQNLILPAEAALGGIASKIRPLSLNELGSDQVCVEIDPIAGAIVGTLFSTFPGDVNFIANCAAAPVAAGNVAEPMGPREAHLGTVTAGVAVPMQYGDPITEIPLLNSTEIWEFYNTTMDAHPIHLHLVRFQVLNRENIDPVTLAPIAGTLTKRLPNEAGYKDTVVAFPGQVTRIKTKFDIAGLYVWHCHIVEHEDNDMMRPFVVAGPATAVTATSLPAKATTIGTSVQITAAAVGGSGTYEYHFLLRSPGGTPVTVQNFSTSAVWNWNTTGLAAGTYQVVVRARNLGSKAGAEASTSQMYNLVVSVPPPASVTLTSLPFKTTTIGTPVQFTAAATGGTGAYEYKFYLLAPGGTLVPVQNYSASAVWNWTTTGLAAGTYKVVVRARSVGGLATSYVRSERLYTLQ